MALRFGLSRDTVVHAGTTDSVAAVIASAPIEPGNAVTSLGSTLVVKLVSKRRIEAPALGLFSHRLGDMWLVGGASNSGCAVLRQHFSDADLARLSARIDPNTPQNLGYYPLPRPGERFPTNDPNMQPQMAPPSCKGCLRGWPRLRRRAMPRLRPMAVGGPGGSTPPAGAPGTRFGPRFARACLGRCR
jgi:sugar (pentulose or hexulose) kinase